MRGENQHTLKDFVNHFILPLIVQSITNPKHHTMRMFLKDFPIIYVEKDEK